MAADSETPCCDPPTDWLITGEEFLRLSDGEPSELIRGRIVRLGWRSNQHGLIAAELSVHIRAFNRKRAIGKLLAGSGIYLERNPDTVRGPDLHFVREERWPNAGSLDGYLEIAPDLCIEIVSPNDSWSKLEEKVGQFLAIGARLIWIIDPATRRARIYRQDGSSEWISGNGVLSGEDILPGFEMVLKDLFAVLD